MKKVISVLLLSLCLLGCAHTKTVIVKNCKDLGSMSDGIQYWECEDTGAR